MAFSADVAILRNFSAGGFSDGDNSMKSFSARKTASVQHKYTTGKQGFPNKRYAQI